MEQSSGVGELEEANFQARHPIASSHTLLPHDRAYESMEYEQVLTGVTQLLDKMNPVSMLIMISDVR